MKYDRPVWQLMYDCADDMPARFRYEDVHAWFAERYPQVGQATLRAHLIGMSEGGRPKPVQFADRTPIFRRVARGMYESIPSDERERDPEHPDPGFTDVGPTPEVCPDASTDTSADTRTGHGTDHPPRDGSGDSSDVFAASAFDDAEVVEARPLEPTNDFDELMARAGLAGKDTLPTDVDADRADILLLGSAGQRVVVPAPAREAFRGEEFQVARVRAQQRGARWFVLSAEHGLVEPQEWISPQSRGLEQLDAEYRSAWAAWVVARLQSFEGSVVDRTVHIDAPASQVGPLVSALLDAGAVVTIAGRADQVAAAGGTNADEPAVADARPVRTDTGRPVSGGAAADVGVRTPDPRPERDEELASAVAALADPARSVSPWQLDPLHDAPGLFAWHVDPSGARILHQSLRLPMRPGVVHIGHAGADGRVPDAVRTIRSMVQDVQWRGRSRSSTFRGTLATILAEPLGLRTLDDAALTIWMDRHLTVATWPIEDPESLLDLWHRTVELMEPSLNIDHLRAADLRHRLGELKQRHG